LPTKLGDNTINYLKGYANGYNPLKHKPDSRNGVYIQGWLDGQGDYEAHVLPVAAFEAGKHLTRGLGTKIGSLSLNNNLDIYYLTDDPDQVEWVATPSEFTGQPVWERP
jgi:hypothetical protein